MEFRVSNYRRTDLPGDITAGLIVAIMLVPQSMAYAMLAGLPAQWGLYASMLPLAIYALLGSSRYLAVGPVAIVSLMIANIAGETAVPGSAAYESAAVTLAWLSGMLLFLFGLLRFGFVANLLSHSVISGFINAAALVIAASQVRHLLGLDVPGSESFFPLLREIARSLPYFHPATAAIGIGAMALLILMRHPPKALLSRLKLAAATVSVISKTGAFVIVIIGAALVWLLDLDTCCDVPVVGEVPRGLPSLSLPGDGTAQWLDLLPGAAVIAFVAYLESISVARSLASKRRQRVHPNRELIALGAANMAAAASGTFPVAGGVSRSGVNFSAGANTRLAGVITASVMALCTLAFSPLFFYIPRAVLAAIVVIAVLRLIDLKPVLQSWAYNRADALSTAVTFVVVLVYNVEAGILCGLVFSLGVYIWRSMHPHIAVVGRVGDTEHYGNVLHHQTRTCPHVVAIRIDESLYFANAYALEERILELSVERKEIRHVVLVCSAVNFIDFSALDSLVMTVDRLRDAGVTLHLAEIKEPLMDRLKAARFPAHLGEGRVFISTHEAMQALECLEPPRVATPAPIN